jgi:predicted membrane protein
MRAIDCFSAHSVACGTVAASVRRLTGIGTEMCVRGGISNATSLLRGTTAFQRWTKHSAGGLQEVG